MKVALQIILALACLAGQALIFETSDWGINYLNAHPTLIKWTPLLIGIGFTFLFTMTISPISNALKPPIVKVPGSSSGTVNPFWGWFAVGLVINIIWNMMLE